MPSRILTGREYRFVAAYLKCRNSTEAALEAGYSPKTARVQGCQLLKRPAVNEALCKSKANIVERLTNINRVRSDALQNAEVSVVRVLKEVATLANYDSDEITPAQRFKYKLPANELLARHLGMVQAPATPAFVGPNFNINIHLGDDEPKRVKDLTD